MTDDQLEPSNVNAEELVTYVIAKVIVSSSTFGDVHANFHWRFWLCFMASIFPCTMLPLSYLSFLVVRCNTLGIACAREDIVVEILGQGLSMAMQKMN